VQQNDIVILLVIAKVGRIFNALSLSLLFSSLSLSLYSLRVFLNAERVSEESGASISARCFF
jgi:hypothetical protein